MSKAKPGYITNIEPIIKPIIPKYVYDLKKLNKKFIKHKNKNPPITSPTPIGIKTDKFKLDIAERYISYNPNNINITVLLIPGITIPVDITIPANIKYELEFIYEVTAKLFSSETRYILKESVKSKHKTWKMFTLFTFVCLITNFILPSIKPINAKEVGI